MWSEVLTMGKVSVLDATLRDGGCVIDFNFGNKYIQDILNALEKSEVEYIELGYIDFEGDKSGDRTKYKSENVIYEKILWNKKSNIEYLAMIDYGKYNIESLEECNPKGIDGIRLAFHKRDWEQAILLGKNIMSKGYKLYVQPMITLRYSDKELLELIEYVNKIIPDVSGVYIVDSFDEMRGKDVIRLMHLMDSNLAQTIALGFHSHNNLQLSYANAMSFLSFNTKRDIMLDSCVMGMGKGAGNLNSELLMEHMNIYSDKKYNIKPLLHLIDTVINTLHYEHYWGYAAQFYLSAINQCSPTYAAYYYDKQMLSIEEIAEILGEIPDAKKISFDRKMAEDLYRKRNLKKEIDDSKSVEILMNKFNDKDVLMIAPGKSVIHEEEKIRKLIRKINPIIINLNHIYFKADYIIITRQAVLDGLKRNKTNKIVLSNMRHSMDENLIVLDYQKWTSIIDNETYDSSGIIGFKLMKELKIKKLYIAGFDGYSLDINQNYFDYKMRKPITEKRVIKINNIYHEIIEQLSKEKNLKFVTKSLYQ